MRIIVAIIVVALDVALPAPAAGLYLITGSPNPDAPTGYRSSLFAVNSTGVTKTLDLVNGPAGTEWIAASQDLRLAVLVPKEPGQAIVLVDFDTATVAKHCVRHEVDRGAIARWLLDTPSMVQYMLSC